MTRSNDSYFDVTVLVEEEISATAARRMTELHQMKSAPVRHNLVRPLIASSSRAKPSSAHTESLLRRLFGRATQVRSVVRLPFVHIVDR